MAHPHHLLFSIFSQRSRLWRTAVDTLEAFGKMALICETGLIDHISDGKPHRAVEDTHEVVRGQTSDKGELGE